jgi:threonine/homoserine/homoserine lactone efflux protein
MPPSMPADPHPMPTLDNFLLFGVASVLLQSLLLGATRIVISIAGDLMFVFSATAVARWLAERPAWALAQRWVLGAVFAGIAVKLALDERR